MLCVHAKAIAPVCQLNSRTGRRGSPARLACGSVDIALLPECCTAASARRCCTASRKRPLPASPVFAPRASAFAKAPADKTAGRLLRIHVERFNPALRLYERLGFRQIDDRGVYLFMEWRDDNAQRSNDPRKTVRQMG
jgi:hypothetical protein